MELLKIDLNCIKNTYKKRPCDSNKGTHGHALLIAGSSNKMGAAIIASKACLRSGVGLLTVAFYPENKSVLFNSIPEAMYANSCVMNDLSPYQAIGIGPGIGVDEISLQYIYQLYENKLPVVFDADALNLIANYKIDWNNFNFPFVLTPHPKEFDRLFGEHDSESERRSIAIQKAAALNCVIVLKGHKTFITDGIHTFENTTGNSGLAKGGSGDALTGMITSFLAQGYTTLEATKLGVYLHGLAADITLETQSEESMLITDVIENIGLAFKHLNSKIQ
ncbi:NAD(P)H-hydrate dehydratase [Flavobacterium cheniae]|uniref:ADP-dependent (S)-NAD(P)H-hydrate dehydratase n=1 Tax=Flavobacterium cheniae TaxID=295428 RepID=A0A562KHF7_9FLAO|nr:NAD(P)H-hydrate dehydratase [Flavobacterium cheniae]TDR24547.1 NAD(P)H-hydrate epimerase [Flavobacterium cheniae]TWH94801.1 NAD(P)H-hydrate epimerase [Flavobacterium cheniae]